MAQQSTRDLWTCGSEAAEFFDILTHDDRNSNYVVACSRDGEWSQTAVKAGALGELDLDDESCAYYVTHNGFNGRKREANRCRQINAIMFDIDCHDGGHDETLPKLISCLEGKFSAGELPQPNLFVETGRGVQIYYVLVRSTPYRVRGGRINESGLEFFKDIESGLSHSFAKAIREVEGAELDTSVFDLPRVGRIPGSFNSKSGTRCRLRSSSRNYYGLIDLKVFCDMESVRRAKSRANKRRPVKYDALLTSRVKMLEELQEIRGFDCVGSRENMCFVMYNTATQVYGPDRAFEIASSFNEKFNMPLPAADIAQIKRTVDNVVVAYGPHKGDCGYYPLKAATIAEKLHLTQAEVAAVGLYSPGRKAQREDAKRKTKEKREARDKRICALYERGYSQAETAKKAGCSPRTVYAVVKRENVVRGNLNESVKAQVREVLAAKRDEVAKSCQTSWVVKGFNENESGFYLEDETGGVDTDVSGSEDASPPLRL